MKKTIMIVSLLGFCLALNAEETVGEKTQTKMHDAKRALKKGVNRTQEKVCMKDDLECLKQKAANRSEETGDYVKDKTKEMKNKVDSE